MTKTIISLAILASLAACGGGGADDDAQALATFQNDAHNQAKANAAASFKAGTYVVTPDPTITLACPRGAGVENVTVNGTTYAQCATYASMPCMTVAALPVLACNGNLH